MASSLAVGPLSVASRTPCRRAASGTVLGLTPLNRSRAGRGALVVRAAEPPQQVRLAMLYGVPVVVWKAIVGLLGVG
jgi:hypothetical protein